MQTILSDITIYIFHMQMIKVITVPRNKPEILND